MICSICKLKKGMSEIFGRMDWSNCCHLMRPIYIRIKHAFFLSAEFLTLIKLIVRQLCLSAVAADLGIIFKTLCFLYVVNIRA